MKSRGEETPSLSIEVKLERVRIIFVSEKMKGNFKANFFWVNYYRKEIYSRQTNE